MTRRAPLSRFNARDWPWRRYGPLHATRLHRGPVTRGNGFNVGGLRFHPLSGSTTWSEFIRYKVGPRITSSVNLRSGDLRKDSRDLHLAEFLVEVGRSVAKTVTFLSGYLSAALLQNLVYESE